MEMTNFLKQLWRHKATLILVPLITVVCTFFLVRHLPNTYRSHARLATGIVDRSDALLKTNDYTQEYKINQEFSNVIEKMLLKKIVNQVSYHLMVHDLRGKIPFRKQSDSLKKMTKEQKEEAARFLADKYNKQEELFLSQGYQNRLHKLLKSMKYDGESIRKKLAIYRVNNSDYIDLQFESENPALSAYVLNTLCKEFLSYNSGLDNENKTKAIAYLDSMMQQKQAALQRKMQALQSYKIRNGVLDVNNQANTLIGQIAEFETKRLEAQKNISAYKGALQNINIKVGPGDKNFMEGTISEMNQDIAATRNRLATTNDDYIKSNFDPKYKTKIDSLQNALTAKINQSNDKQAYNSMTPKKNLLEEKLNLEVSLDLAENSVASLNGELNRLNSKLHTLVPNQAAIKALQDDIDLYTQEYIELSNKFNQANLESNFSGKIKLVEMASPGIRQPSKKLLLVILSGMIAFTLCVVAFFIIFYLDNSIQDAHQLANATNLPVIGMLYLIKSKMLDLQEVWSSTDNKMEIQELKNNLRTLRFEIDEALNQSKIIGITSFNGSEGKTFLALNLAYAYSVRNKKVLLIDGNFNNPEISKTTNPDNFLEDYLQSGRNGFLFAGFPENFMVLGNYGGDTSLLEICNEEDILSKMQALKNQFDIILIEMPSLDADSKAKEWMRFAEKIVPVFAAGHSIKDTIQKHNLKYLQQMNDKLLGWVLNKVKIGNEKKRQAKNYSKNVTKKSVA